MISIIQYVFKYVSLIMLQLLKVYLFLTKIEFVLYILYLLESFLSITKTEQLSLSYGIKLLIYISFIIFYFLFEIQTF